MRLKWPSETSQLRSLTSLAPGISARNALNIEFDTEEEIVTEDSARDRLSSLKADPFSEAIAWKERTGGRVLGYFCSYVPEELIYAAGALPVRIMGEDRRLEKSDGHLQSYCCSLARTSLDMALCKDLSFLDGTVFVHTCDTMQRLSDIWRLNAGLDFHADVVLPVKMEGENSRKYLEEEIASFQTRLEEYMDVNLDEQMLRAGWDICEGNRLLLRDIYSIRRERPGVMPYSEALWAVTSSTLMDKREHSLLLKEMLSEAKMAGDKQATGTRLFLTGSIFDQWELLDSLESMGAVVVDDDLCNGSRYIEGGPSSEQDPMTAVADRLFNRTLCPCKHADSRPRLGYFLDRVKSSGAQGVIFFLLKFCEPHAFDYPYLKNALDESNIPSLLLEIEQGSVSLGGMVTRLEAFLEILRSE